MKDVTDTNAGAGNGGAGQLPERDLGPQDIAVLRHEQDGTTAYRFVAPGVLLAGVARVTVQGDWWHAEQLVDGELIAVDADDEMGAILALIARRQGFAIAVGPDDHRGRPALEDPAVARVFNVITGATARAGRFVPLSARAEIAAEVVADLRAAGIIG